MIKISHEREAEALNILPIEVVTKVTKIVSILDDNYGRQMDVDYNLGGYVLVAEVAKETEMIGKLIDLGYTLQEYVELIACSTGQCYKTL